MSFDRKTVGLTVKGGYTDDIVGGHRHPLSTFSKTGAFPTTLKRNVEAMVVKAPVKRY